jgi:predicted nucleotidyltransferase
LTPYKLDIQNICRELRLQRLDLIGSATRDDFSDDSDIDVLVTFEGDKNLFDRYFSLKEKLEEIFKRKVDVIVGCLNRFFSVDRFLDSQCQSRRCSTW